MTPDVPVYQEIQQVIRGYMNEDAESKMYACFPYPQRYYALCEMLRHHVLKEAGDIKHYLTLRERIKVDPKYQESSFDRLVDLQQKWLFDQMRELQPFESSKPKLVISILMYGESYTKKFLNYGLKSMMASLPLEEMQIIFHIQTDEKTKAKIPMIDGAHIEFAIIPDEIIAQLTPGNPTYWMLGTASSLGLHYAKKSGAAFHQSYPDMIYSDKYFQELLRLSKSHHNILGLGMRADESMLYPEIAPYCKDIFSIPAADLMALHLNCWHISIHPNLVNNRPDFMIYPQTHILVWESENCVHFNSPHMAPIWISAETLRDLPDRFYMTNDSEMDLICKGLDFYIPQEQDELYSVECSEQGRSQFNQQYGDAALLGDFFWNLIGSRDLFKIFVKGMKVKLNRDIRPLHIKVMTSENVLAEQRHVFNSISSADPFRGMSFKRGRCYERSVFN